MVNLLRDFYFSCSGVDLTLIAVLVITLRTMGAIGELSACFSFNDSHWSRFSLVSCWHLVFTTLYGDLSACTCELLQDLAGDFFGRGYTSFVSDERAMTFIKTVLYDIIQTAPQAFNRPQHNIRMSEHTLMTDVN